MHFLLFISFTGLAVGQTVFNIPASRPENAAELDETPVAVSYVNSANQFHLIRISY